MFPAELISPDTIDTQAASRAALFKFSTLSLVTVFAVLVLGASAQNFQSKRVSVCQRKRRRQLALD